MIMNHQIETAMNALGYFHGRHEDQRQRVADFRRIVRGSNFMTPRVAGLYRLMCKPYVIVEITTGEFLGDDLIGCTVVDCAIGERLHDESKCLHSLDELAGYFADLGRKFA